MDDSPFVPVGRVVKVHGVKGEVSVAVAADASLLFPEGAEVWVVPPLSGPSSHLVEGVRPGPKGPLVKLSGIDERGAAEVLRGRTLMRRREDLPAGAGDEERSDVEGMTVFDADRGLLGQVADTIETGANDVWIVEGGPFGQVLIPVIDQVVLGIDDDSGRIDVRLLPGLLPEEDAT